MVPVGIESGQCFPKLHPSLNLIKETDLSVKTPENRSNPSETTDQWSLSMLNPYADGGYFRPKHKDATIFENHLNPVMLVFIGKLSWSTLR